MGTRVNPDIDRTDREPVMGMLSIEPVECELKDPCISRGVQIPLTGRGSLQEDVCPTPFEQSSSLRANRTLPMPRSRGVRQQ